MKFQFIESFNQVMGDFQSPIQMVEYLVNVTNQALIDTICNTFANDTFIDIKSIITIEIPEAPRTLYKIYCREILIVAVSATLNSDSSATLNSDSSATYQIIANKNTKKIFSSFNDLLNEFYDVICHFVSFNKIDIRDKKIKINSFHFINAIINLVQCKTQKKITSTKVAISTGDPICDAYNEGANDARNEIINHMLTAAGSDPYIKNFLIEFFKLPLDS